MISNEGDKTNKVVMPFVRDRIGELEQVQCEDEENTGKKKKKQKTDKDMQLYLKECDSIRAQFQRMDENTKRIETFLETGTFYKFEDLQNVVNPLSKDTNKIMGAINKKLREIKIDKDDIDRVPSASNKMKFMQFTSLREGFKVALDSYSNAMRKYEETLQKMKRGVQRTVQGENYDESEELLGEEYGDMYAGNYFAEKRQAEMQLRDVEDRHGQILEIEKQIIEVKDLFVHIAICVEEQQELVNRAEYHAAISTRAVEMANEELVSAKKKKKSALKIKVILIVAAVVILILVIISCFV